MRPKYISQPVAVKSTRLVEHAMEERHVLFFAETANVDHAHPFVLTQQAADRRVDVSRRCRDAQRAELLFQSKECRLEDAVARSESAQHTADGKPRLARDVLERDVADSARPFDERDGGPDDRVDIGERLLSAQFLPVGTGKAHIDVTDSDMNYMFVSITVTPIAVCAIRIVGRKELP